MTVTLINLFDVAADRDETFLAMWEEVNDYMRTQPGYIHHELHRALAPNARYRFVNVAVWESAQALQASHTSEGFRAQVSRPEWAEFPSTPGAFELVHSGP